MQIVFIGDSITEGLGVIRSKTNYANLLQAQLKAQVAQPVHIVNFGSSAMQVSESRERHEQRILEMQPDIVVFAHGITEAIPRVQKKHLKWMPKRWRRPGWMDPRPYYSSRTFRRVMEKVESGARWRAKVALIQMFGGKPWMSLEEFRRHTTEFVHNVLNHNRNTRIILLATSDIEDKYFPGASESIRMYRQVFHEICNNPQSANRVFVCDAARNLHKWNDYLEDRFHPNGLGHDKIARALLNTILGHSLGGRMAKKEVSL